MTTTVDKQIEDLDQKIRSGDEKQYLTFQLGEEELGINILNIKEIISYAPVTRIPMVPEYIVGVMNVRGNVVPVVNLSPRFGKKTGEVSRLTCIIIVEIAGVDDESMDIGIMVDSVEDVIEINNINIEPPPDFGAKIPAEYIAGIGKHHENFIMLLNVEVMLSTDELGDFESFHRFSALRDKDLAARNEVNESQKLEKEQDPEGQTEKGEATDGE